ncbi:MAG: hypothetical protein ACRCWI_03720 [Brevinema sp.]
MKNLLLAMMFIASTTFADDVWFVSPQNGQSIQQKSLEIQIQPPYGNVPSVNVWIEYDMGRDQTVWTGTLTSKNNYKTTVDVSKFRPGKYEVKAEYYINGKDFDGDVDIWIGDVQEQYFPQN